MRPSHYRRSDRRETCVGIDEANGWLAQWLEGFENWSLDVEEVLDAGGSGRHNRPSAGDREARRPEGGDAFWDGLDVSG
jgi:hypothetical protein